MLTVKKALSSAFFITFFWVLVVGVSSNAEAICLPAAAAVPVDIAKVVDGDTVRLSSGRSVRLLGINTPELNVRSGEPEPYAVEAREKLRRIVGRSESGLVLGVDEEDRYKRLLGHLVIDKKTAAEHLLLAGLGWAVAVEPNTELADCLFKSEQQARKAKRGVWAQTIMTAANLSQGGFALVQGRVSRVDSAKRYIYVELDDQVALRFSREQLNNQQVSMLEASLGERVEARGWIIDRRDQLKLSSRYKPFLLPITSHWHFAIL